MTFDGKVFGAEIVAIVKGHVERSLAPLNARLDAFEKMIAALPRPKDGEPGKSITPDDVAPMIKAEADRIGAEILEAAKAIVGEAVASLPPAAAGKDADPELIKQMVAEAVAALPPAEKGKDADPVEVAATIKAEVERAVAALPAPRDGKSVTAEELRPMVEEVAAKAVAAIPVPKDGIDAMDVMVDREGNLVFTMSDGRMKNVGMVVGKDADIAPLERTIAERLASIPSTKDVDTTVVSRFVAEELARISKDGPAEFAPDDVAANISSAIKMIAERPSPRGEEEGKSSPSSTINIALSDNRDPPTVNLSMPEQQAPIVKIEPAVVNVAPASVTIEARRSKEVTTVTGYDKNGRIKSFEKTEVDE